MCSRDRGKIFLGSAAKEIFDNFGGTEDAWHARAGMGACSDEIEPRDIFAFVVEAEPSGLREDRGDGKPGAVRGLKSVAEIGRGDVELGDEVFFEIGENGFFELLEDALRVAGAFEIPVNRVLEIRDGGEDIECIVTFGCHGGIGGGRAMQVEAEVFGKNAALEDVVEEFAVARAEEDGVMGDFLVAAVGGEVENEEAHGIVAAGEFGIGPLAAVRRRNEVTVNRGRVGIGYDEVRIEGFAAGEADA